MLSLRVTVATSSEEIRNAGFWAEVIRQSFIPEVEAYARCLVERLLPTFTSVESEADALDEKFGHHAAYEVDPADLAEHAVRKWVEYVDTMQAIEQGLINMFGVGLWHLLEQQLLFFHRRELLRGDDQQNEKLWTLKEMRRRLARAHIQVERFSAWPRIEELRHLANAVKHADGGACDALKKLRPDLFVRPRRYDPQPVDESLREAYLASAVFQPIAGESIYLPSDGFREYGAAVVAFLSELATVLESGAERPTGR